MSNEIKELEHAYSSLEDAREYLAKTRFTILASRVCDIYEQVEDILNALYDAKEEE